MNPLPTPTDVKHPIDIHPSDLTIGVMFIVFLAVTVFTGGNVLMGLGAAILFGIPLLFIIAIAVGIHRLFH